MIIRPEQIDLSSYASSSEIATASGYLQSQISDNSTNIATNSGNISTLDTKINNASGTLNDKIVDTSGAIPTDFYSTSAINSLSGYLDGKIIDTSGAIPTDFYTTGQIDSMSGYLDGLIPDNIEDLDNVTISTPASGESLIYNGSIWINQSGAGGGGGVTDHGALTGLDDDDHSAIYYNKTTINNISGALSSEIDSDVAGLSGVLVSAYQSADNILSGHLVSLIPTGIAMLDDVTISTPLSGEVLQYDGTGWINISGSSGGGGGAEELNDLDDVSTSSPASGQALIYNGSNWVNRTTASARDAILLFKDANQLINNGTTTAVTWPNPLSTTSTYSHTSGQGTIYVNASGTYTMKAILIGEDEISSANGYVYKNGSQATRHSCLGVNAGGITMEWIDVLTSGEYVEFRIYFGGGNRNIYPSSRCYMEKIG